MKSDALRDNQQWLESRVTRRWGVLYEIHGYGIQGFSGIGSCLRSHRLWHTGLEWKSGVWFAGVLDEDWKSGPIVLHAELMKVFIWLKWPARDGHVSTGEHAVGDFWSLEHRCVWVWIKPSGSRVHWVLTDCRVFCGNGSSQSWDWMSEWSFQHHDERSMEDWDW